MGTRRAMVISPVFASKEAAEYLKGRSLAMWGRQDYRPEPTSTTVSRIRGGVI